MTDTIPTYTIPTPSWVSAVHRGEDRSPHARFQMYSERGNEAVATVVRTVIEAGAYCPLTRDEALHLLRTSLDRLQHVHPEFHDTEPDGEIRDVISRGFHDLGFRGLTEDEIL